MLAKKIREDSVRTLVAALYESRQARRTHPEGRTDGARWYPSPREDADGDGSCTRSPSRAWPWSFMLRCRTRQHCRVLVERGLTGRDVPDDVRAVLGARSELVTECVAAVSA